MPRCTKAAASLTPKSGRLAEAIRDFDQAIALNPRLCARLTMTEATLSLPPDRYVEAIRRLRKGHRAAAGFRRRLQQPRHRLLPDEGLRQGPGGRENVRAAGRAAGLPDSSRPWTRPRNRAVNPTMSHSTKTVLAAAGSSSRWRRRTRKASAARSSSTISPRSRRTRPSAACAPPRSWSRRPTSPWRAGRWRTCPSRSITPSAG